MASNKRTVVGIAIITVIFLVFSIFLTANMYNGLDFGHESKFNDSYVSIVKEKLDIDLKGEDTFAHVEELKERGYDVLVKSKKYTDYFMPSFDFIIERNMIVVKRISSLDFYNYPDLKVGSKIVKIDGKAISEVETYNDALELILAKSLPSTKTFTLDDGKEITYVYELTLDNKTKFSETSDAFTISMVDLNLTAPDYVAEKAYEHEHVIFDLSKASISDFAQMSRYISMFVLNDKVSIYKNIELRPTYGLKLFVDKASNKIKSVAIKLGDNQDEGINFLVKAILGVNEHIAVDRTPNVSEFMASNLYSDYNYDLTLYDTRLESKATSNGDVSI